jgi:hypothetical protein
MIPREGGRGVGMRGGAGPASQGRKVGGLARSCPATPRDQLAALVYTPLRVCPTHNIL